MSFFNRLFSSDKSNNESVRIPWHELKTMAQLDQIVEDSKVQPVAIFKHSTRCGISSMALNRFEKDYNLTDDQVTLYYLDLISFRDISNEISFKFGIMHESPQLLLIKNGEVVYHASHSAIDPSAIAQFA